MLLTIIAVSWIPSAIFTYIKLNEAVISRDVSLNSYRKAINFLMALALGPIGLFVFLIHRLWLAGMYLVLKTLIMTNDYLEKSNLQADVLDAAATALYCQPTYHKPPKTNEERQFIHELIEHHNSFIETMGLEYAPQLNRESLEGVIKILKDYNISLFDKIEEWPRQVKLIRHIQTDINETIERLEKFM